MRSDALITCVVAGVKYLIHPQKLGSIDADIDADALVPVTLLTTSQIFDGNVDNLLLLYDIYDDVFTPEFGAVLVEKIPANTTDYLDDSALVARVHRRAENSTTRDFEQLPSGPYFLYGPNLYQAWRLYEDDLDAFTMGVIPEDIDSPDTFRTLTSLTENGSHRLVAVPSKLYHPPPGPSGPDKPLSGVRIAVSDAIAVKGVPRTLSSRAWSAIHPEGSQKSAQVVKELVSLGAVVVGKTKTAQFTAGRDWVDVSAPFSPRGDHYPRPAGSSAGAFASLTGYDWLRHVLADDAQGSSLDLSAQEGAFSLRPSPELLSRKGSTSVSPSLSGLTVSSRLLDQLLQIAKAVLKPISASTEPISSLIRIIDLETDLREDEMALYEQFVQTLENYLGVKSTPWNLTALWELDPPTVTKQNTLRESMNQMSLKSFALEFYRTFSGFRTTYQKMFKRKPYIEPTVKEYWAIGANVTEGEIEVAAQSLQDFKDWFMEHFLANDATTAIVLPVHRPDAIYRDEPLPHMAHNVFTYSGLSALLGLPSLVAPYAQLSYESDISGREEYLPIASSVLGSPGSDIALLELVQKAYHLAQWRTKVDTGRLAFPVADNQRNVDDQHMSENQHASLGGGLDSRQAVEKDVQWAPLEL